MSLTIKTKILISLGVILGVTAAGIPAIVIPVNNYNTVTLTLLENAGVMIEARGLRIYIDPINLPYNYSTKPADAILITHEHEDHYQFGSMSLIQKNDTLNIFPAIMTTPIMIFDGLGVIPGDQFQVGSITVTAFYMYTYPVLSYPASHPKENNYTSYLIDIGDFSIFHAGDSKNINEYKELTNLVDVVLLPLGPGCQTMENSEIVNVISVIKPSYFIPIHYDPGAYDSFVSTYESMMPNCELIQLAYFSSYKFKS